MSLKHRIFIFVLLLLFILSWLFLPCLGQTFESFGSEIYGFRFYRTMLALIAGSGLALAGLVFQAMFRNSLATPYTLGVASGAAFGAALCLHSTLRLGFPAVLGFVPTVSLGAFVGAALTMGIVLTLSQHRDTTTEKMLLAGVAVNFFFSSLIAALQYLSDSHDTVQILRWTMGGVQNAVKEDIFWLTPFVLLLMLFLAPQSRTLNVYVTGSDRAKSLGINVRRFRASLFIATSLVVGVIVSVTGPIGFVGLMIPHVARLLLGPDHRLLIITTALMGGCFLALCDTLGRLIFSPAELPVGIITSVLGGPFFLWLLFSKNRY